MPQKIDPFVRYCAKSTFFIDSEVVAPDARILYIISGEGEFITRERQIPLSPSTLIYYPPRCPYRIKSPNGMLFYTLNFDFDRSRRNEHPAPFRPVSPTEMRFDGEVDLPQGFSSLLELRDASALEFLLCNVCREYAVRSELSAVAASAWLKLLLIELLRGAGIRKNSLVEQVKALIREDVRQNNRSLAERMNYHPYYLNQVFSAAEGISLHQYIIRERAVAARDLITTGTLSLEKIAEMTGFSSASHLSRTIRTYYGVPPSTFRKM